METQNKSVVDNIMGAVPLLGTVYGIGQAIFGKSQEENQRLQIEGQKEMTDYNSKKSIQMIHDSTAAQKQAFKDNNLNTALMYGGSGAGGTSQIQQGGMPSGVIAPNAVEKGKLALETASTMANIKLMESQSEKNKAEATKIAGTDTKLGETQIENLTQGIENQKAVEELTKAQTILQNLNNSIADQTKDTTVYKINWEAQTAMNIAEKAFTERIITQDTKEAVVNKIKQEAISVVLTNAMMKADIKLKGIQGEALKNNIETNKAQANKWAAEIIQKDREIGQGDKKVAAELLRTGMNTEVLKHLNGLYGEDGMKAIEKIMKMK